MKKSLLFISTALLTLSANAQDTFLSGFANACNASTSYSKFQKDLCKPKIEKNGVESCSLGKISLPENYKSLLDSNTSKNEGDFTLFTVKLKPGMSFAGNNVTAIEQWSGHSNGIFGSALVLDSTDIKLVKNNIKSSNVVLKKNKTEMGIVGASVDKGKDGKVRIICDLSD